MIGIDENGVISNSGIAHKVLKKAGKLGPNEVQMTLESLINKGEVAYDNDTDQKPWNKREFKKAMKGEGNWEPHLKEWILQCIKDVEKTGRKTVIGDFGRK